MTRLLHTTIHTPPGSRPEICITAHPYWESPSLPGRFHRGFLLAPKWASYHKKVDTCVIIISHFPFWDATKVLVSPSQVVTEEGKKGIEGYHHHWGDRRHLWRLPL